jgi:uncharacterized phage-associated protein
MKQAKPLGKVSATVLANYILMSYGPMSHLKLQKLLYYSEAYHLAYFDQSLIDEQFQAWLHGPVCRKVYNELKGESILYSDISFDGKSEPAKEILENLNSNQIELLNDVLKELSTWRAFELERATHREVPWIEARKGYGPADRCDVIISKETMRIFYKSELSLG